LNQYHAHAPSVTKHKTGKNQAGPCLFIQEKIPQLFDITSFLLASSILILHFFVSLLLLSFIDPPEIVERPKDVAVRSGGIAAFYCRARGEPTPQLSWRKNGRKVCVCFIFLLLLLYYYLFLFFLPLPHWLPTRRHVENATTDR
jgi:netrin-G3 ligand